VARLACAQCAAELDPSDRFCPRCGVEVDAADSTGVISAIGDSAPLPPVTSSGHDLASGQAALIVQGGPDHGTRFVLSSSDLVVGRSDESDVFLDDVTVSRRHAVIVRGADGWSISDDGSLNGTYVNRRLAEGSVALASGDEVQLGKYRFVFVEASRS